LKYRDVEYTVVQGIGRQLWRWEVALEGKALTGQAATKAEAVAEAERAIDRALAPKKLKLVRPERDRQAGKALPIIPRSTDATWSSFSVPVCELRSRPPSGAGC
jgi:hypothetical protein